MQRYASVADVQARVPRTLLTIDEESAVSDVQVEEWLDAHSQWVDGTLSWRYAVPLTDPESGRVLRPIVALLAAADVWDHLGGHAVEPMAQPMALRRTAHQMLGYQATTGRSNLLLTSATYSSSGEAAVQQPVSSFTDPDSATATDFTFKVGEDSW